MRYPPIQWVQWLIFAAAVALGAMNLVPSWRHKLRTQLIKPQRVVLSQAQGVLIPLEPAETVVKVLNQDHIAIEIYSAPKEPGGVGQLIYSIDLPEKRDAYFNYSGVTTNLVLGDIDHDGMLEILAPTFDEDLIPRLRVYKYDLVSKTFYRLEPNSVK